MPMANFFIFTKKISTFCANLPDRQKTPDICKIDSELTEYMFVIDLYIYVCGPRNPYCHQHIYLNINTINSQQNENCTSHEILILYVQF